MRRREFLTRSVAASAAAGLSLPGARAAQNPAPLQTVNIVGTSGTTTLVMSALLNRMGYLTEQGIAPNFINVGDGTKVVAALVTGAADICPQAGFTQVLAAIEKGAPLKIAAGSADKNFNAVFSNNPAVK